MRSDEKLEFWKLMAGIFAEWGVPSNDDGLVHRIHIVTDFRDQVREEMDSYYKVEPKTKRFFDLYDLETENRRNAKFVEDGFTEEWVLESELVRRSFNKFEKQVYFDVARFNYPLSNLEHRLKVLELEAVHRGISVPERRHQEHAESDDGHPCEPPEQACNPRNAGRPPDPEVMRRRRAMFEFLQKTGARGKSEAKKLVTQLDFRERLYGYFHKNGVAMVKSDNYEFLEGWPELKKQEYSSTDLKMSICLEKDIHRNWDRFWNNQN